MKAIEDKIQRHKQNLNQIQAPAELEDRLRQALHRIPEKKRRNNKALMWSISAAAALLIIVSTYQYPAFAYIGGKLLNRMELTSLSFSEVAEQGYGQTVNKSKTFKDGTVITINGVIADDNAFLMYYTVKLPEGLTFKADEFIRYGVTKVKGFLTNSNVTEGGGNYSKDKTQFQGVYKFEPVNPFSRTLTANFSERLDSGEQEIQPISFKFEANKAMKSIINEKVSREAAVDEGTVHYDSVIASPTSTVIRGHYELNNNGGHPMFPGKTKLLVNGTEVESFGYRSGGLDGKNSPTFEFSYDVLPTDKIESLEIVLDKFSGYQKITKPIPLTSPSDRSIKMSNEKLWIRSVTQTVSGYDIVIASKEFTILDTTNLFVQAGGKKVPIASRSVSRPWDLGNGNILREQTYSVQAQDKPEFLLVEGFHYIKEYNKKISIPITQK
ncbi:DUF4179 domain-containing protein [Paenibacillus sp. JDR-2]|uniref:DUF4179 domain-containing protein n=1 Tax=Paenibacillus sp. (strain JDR-2) TaxID=324057 RepID=UPI0001666B3A|nr:DUF4179 domain-containing protein [Paenibacillus sp. JDR-2]ACT03131.1 conserved hypothetical protein [Paenibacillus sp. JDR-2]